MGLGQLWREVTGQGEEVGAAAPAPAPDEQDLLGNSFIGDFLGTSAPAPVARSGIGDLVEQEVDELAARQELEGMFDTENGLPTDGRAAVSADEFDEIVRTYSEIRRGKTNLTLDTANLDPEQAAAFRSGAMGDIAKMMQTESGRRLISELAYNEKGMRTSIGAPVAGGEPHTEGYLDGERDCRESYAKDRPGDPTGWCIDDRSHDGTGVDSDVRYRPGAVESTPDGEIRSDVTLYHELAHALHNVRGDQARGGVPLPSDVSRSVGNEEFQATGLGRWAYEVDEHGDLVPNENLYRSERRDLGDDLEDRPSYGGATP